ncbi:MAG: phosphate ABC transporter ATP-binding protein PstB [Coriobacteriales bacterium]|nr:phosphate ABC transporter ATP-binding protein PstB [Coriobacteriales bacterium]
MMQITERDTRGAAVEAEMREPVLATHDVGVRYDETKVALSGVNLEFAAGEVTSLIGPSGCGKSTFLRCLNLMNREIPHCHIDGEIVYDGHNINTPDENLYELRQSIGMVFQIPNPFRKSIRDNITFAPRCHGIKDKKRLDEIVETSLVKAALWDEVKDKLDKSAYALSGGQRQRLCIARTLAMNPKVVLMDEPCSALDPIATFSIEDTIGQIAGEGISVIIVTHNIEQAARISDKTAYFLLGEVVEWGDTDAVFSDPKDKRTQDYLTGRFG